MRVCRETGVYIYRLVDLGKILVSWKRLTGRLAAFCLDNVKC